MPFSLLFFLSWVPDDRFFLSFFLFLARVLQKKTTFFSSFGTCLPVLSGSSLLDLYLLPALRKTKQMKAAQCRTEPIPRSFFSQKTASRARVNLAAISPTRRSVSSWDKLDTLELQSHSLYLLPSGFITSFRRCFFFFFSFLLFSFFISFDPVRSTPQSLPDLMRTLKCGWLFTRLETCDCVYVSSLNA